MNLNLFSSRLRQNFPLVKEPASMEHSAAVMLILFPYLGRTHVLMIKRAMTLKLHKGEIAFPGGIFEDDDEHLLDTALRETQEEIDLEIPIERVMARMNPVETRTGFIVSPFVTLLDQAPDCRDSFNEDEVEEVLFIPLTPLIATQQRDVGFKREEEMYVYWYERHRIWGASAKMLHQLGELIF
ncbi:MAG: CoA pyrophosphatase [Candidatus Nitrohelix vancouverensis]|uniref:CoA pyrophosphatase n=1 Tax=Candidatus Nitrohelix vancouverensis TaxID=2705534 RepID=A0A7T0C1M6_9BACT|nr:MAG: CoA pyrophosphatase [Candidatus Nitrohelix vancouverensis]